VRILYSKAITKIQAVIVGIIVIVAIAASVGAYLLFVSPSKEKTEILVGAAVSLTGGYSEHGKQVAEGYRLWEEDVNSRGGLLGKPARFIIYDDKSDPTTTKSLYERLITIDQVDLLLGPYPSSCAMSSAPVAEKYKMVVIYPAANSVTVYNYTATGWDFQFCAHPVGLTDRQFLPFFYAVTNLLSNETMPKTIAIVNTADVFPRTLAAGLVKLIETQFRDYGFKIVFKEEIPSGATDVTAVISKAKDSGGEIFFALGYLSGETLLLRTCYDLGYRPKMFVGATAGATKQFYSTAGAVAEGVTAFVFFHPSYPTKMAQDFVQKFRQKYGRDPEHYDSLAYAACQILEAAVRAVGRIDHTAIRDWLVNHSVETIWGTWEVDHDRIKEGFRYVPKVKAGVGQWQNGKWEVVWPKEYATAKFIYPKPWP